MTSAIFEIFERFAGRIKIRLLRGKKNLNIRWIISRLRFSVPFCSVLCSKQ